MKRISMIIGLALISIFLAYVHTRTSKANSQTRQSTLPTKTTKPQVKTIDPATNITAAQTRVNRYFQGTVVAPKLRDCWNRLQGEGVMAMEFTYRKSGGTWTFAGVRVAKSSLAGRQNAAALKCMQDSARSTSFGVETSDGPEKAAPKLVLRWDWPVPLPAEGSPMSTSQIARMRGSGGWGETGGCQKCVSRNRYPYGEECRAASDGYTDCRSDVNDPNVCSYGDACLSGGFGLAGGRVFIY